MTDSSHTPADTESPRLQFVQEGYGAWIRAMREQTLIETSCSPEITEEHPSVRTGRILDDSNATIRHFFDIPDDYKSPTPGVTFDAIQEWEGYVLEIGDKKFTSRLLDLTAGASIEEKEAIIPLTEISETDRKHLCLGSIFRWSIGYERSSSGTKKRISHIVFRDLPVVSKQDMVKGEKWAKEVLENVTI